MTELEIYLKSKEWKEKKKIYKKRIGHKCLICCTEDHLDIYHLNTERLGEEYHSDVACLCKECFSILNLNPEFKNKIVELRKQQLKNARRNNAKKYEDDRSAPNPNNNPIGRKQATQRHKQNFREYADKFFEYLKENYSIDIGFKEVMPLINKRGHVVRATESCFFEFARDMKTLKIYDNHQDLLGTINLIEFEEEK